MLFLLIVPIVIIGLVSYYFVTLGDKKKENEVFLFLKNLSETTSPRVFSDSFLSKYSATIWFDDIKLEVERRPNSKWAMTIWDYENARFIYHYRFDPIGWNSYQFLFDKYGVDKPIEENISRYFQEENNKDQNMENKKNKILSGKP